MAETRQERAARYTKKNREAGLVQISAWVPEAHRASLLALCHKLRDEHLNSEVNKLADELGYKREGTT